MSETYTKHAIRIIIPELKNSSVDEQYQYFRKIFGEAKYVYEDDGLVDYFHYENDNFQVVGDNKGNVGIDIILERKPEYDVEPMILSLTEIQDKVSVFTSEYNFEIENTSNIYVVSYNWYTGVDEPYVYSLFND